MSTNNFLNVHSKTPWVLHYEACVDGNCDALENLILLYPLSESLLLASGYLLLKAACLSGHLDVVKLLLSTYPKIDMSDHFSCLFQNSCKNGHLNIAQFLFNYKENLIASQSTWSNAWWSWVDKKMLFQMSLRIACKHGQKHVVEWLWSILVQENYHELQLQPAINCACESGNIELVRWLFKQTDSSVEWTIPFRLACENKHAKLAYWIHLFDKTRFIVVLNEDNTTIVKWNVYSKPLPVNNTKINYEKNASNNLSVCSICYEQCVEIQTDCKHDYCVECIQKWRKTCGNYDVISCPYCRSSVHEYTFV